MEDNHQESYKMLVKDITPLSYKDVAEDWEKNASEWYHAIVTIEDLPVVLAIPNLRIYAWCRCKLVADDGSESHFHWHAVVHFTKSKLSCWKKQSRRCGIRFTSSKNTFKKIKCLDHAVGVLRYLACKDVQKVRHCDGDGLVTHPHTHYSRQPIEENHRHERGKRCAAVRNEISEGIAMHMDLERKENWDKWNLHDARTCLCDCGDVGKAKRDATNEKRRAFYKSNAGVEIKKKYREKAAIKRNIFNQLSELNVSEKAELSLEKIASLIKQLQ